MKTKAQIKQFEITHYTRYVKTSSNDTGLVKTSHSKIDIKCLTKEDLEFLNTKFNSFVHTISEFYGNDKYENDSEVEYVFTIDHISEGYVEDIVDFIKSQDILKERV